MQLPSPTWFVGCGNMAGAMIDGWKAAHVDMSKAVAIRPSGIPVPGMRTVTSVKEAGDAPQMIVLGFKPQQLDEISPELANWVTSKTTVASLLAGIEAGSLRRRFPRGTIVRVAPNLPVSIRRGVVALHSDGIEEGLRRELSELFAALGFTMWTESETALAAIGSVAGAGPAYAARFIAALASAGEGLGLPKALAETIARETVLGTAWMSASSGEGMTDIARRVASRNGTTEAGLAVLDKDGSLDRLVGETIDAAAARGRSLAEAARLS
ncbi:MAG TPA: pyrroline-5-carboxylate reductase dimerization domain-containing protein [Sphingomicrobium sp.]|nr:pyrroline-5-carboxylate reductase dimerization domain-containing protein [Sphingomicrobium sp.]